MTRIIHIAVIPPIAHQDFELIKNQNLYSSNADLKKKLTTDVFRNCIFIKRKNEYQIWKEIKKI